MSPISKQALAAARVLVVGDAMLDRYWHGAVDRISPEAPVPVVRITREEERVGAAASRCESVRCDGEDLSASAGLCESQSTQITDGSCWPIPVIHPRLGTGGVSAHALSERTWKSSQHSRRSGGEPYLA